MGVPILSELVSVGVSQTWMAYFMVIALLVGDSFLAQSLNFGGIFGWIVNTAVTAISKHDLHITSAWILFFVVIIPICGIALKRSRQPTGR